MIRGIAGKPYINLDPFLDIKGFTDLHPEISKGLALAREFAKEGTWTEPGYDQSYGSYIWDWKPVYKTFKEYNSLPDDHPIKVNGAEIFPKNFKDYKQLNVFTRYLKCVLGANDPYLYYFLWSEGDWDLRTAREKTYESKYFPNVVRWVENLQEQGVIDRIGRVLFFLCDHNGKAFEHRDAAKNDYTPHNTEFIHIRYRTKRGFYIWDPESQDKHYINSHASFWNGEDWHGGEHSLEQEYSLRINCNFTKDFREKIGISNLTTHY